MVTESLQTSRFPSRETENNLHNDAFRSAQQDSKRRHGKSVSDGTLNSCNESRAEGYVVGLSNMESIGSVDTNLQAGVVVVRNKIQDFSIHEI